MLNGTMGPGGDCKGIMRTGCKGIIYPDCWGVMAGGFVGTTTSGGD